MVFEHQGEHNSRWVCTGVPSRVWLQTVEDTHSVFLSYLASSVAIGGVVVLLTRSFVLPGLLVGKMFCAVTALIVMWRRVVRMCRELKAAEEQV